MIVSVHCAARWDTGSRYDLKGPVVELDLDRPNTILIDGRGLIVSKGEWVPERTVTLDGETDTLKPEIYGRLPMENGAILDITWPHEDVVMISVGLDTPDGWMPLDETEEDIRPSHQGCLGSYCTDPTCGSRILREDEKGISSTTHAEILMLWERIGSKPVNLHPELKKRKIVKHPRRRPTLIEKRMEIGETVTLEEWKKAQ